MSRLIEILGAERARWLMTGWGGERVYIPMQVPENHWLRDIAGPHLEEMVREWGGVSFECPKGATLYRRERDRQILELAAQGATVIELVRKFGLSQRRIKQILESGRREERRDEQSSLLPSPQNPSPYRVCGESPSFEE